MRECARKIENQVLESAGPVQRERIALADAIEGDGVGQSQRLGEFPLQPVEDELPHHDRDRREDGGMTRGRPVDRAVEKQRAPADDETA